MLPGHPRTAHRSARVESDAPALMTIHAVYAGLLSSTARMGVPLADSGAKIKVGDHAVAHWLGMTFNVDTIISTAVAAVIVIALAIFLRVKMTSGVPNGVQLFF